MLRLRAALECQYQPKGRRLCLPELHGKEKKMETKEERDQRAVEWYRNLPEWVRYEWARTVYYCAKDYMKKVMADPELRKKYEEFLVEYRPMQATKAEAGAV